MFEEIAARIESNRDVRQDSRLDAMVRCARLGPAYCLLVRLLRGRVPRSKKLLVNWARPAVSVRNSLAADRRALLGSASVRKRWPPKETGRQENREKRISHEPTW